jgi:hypothetical protein
MVLRRRGDWLCARLGLKELDYGAPPLNLAAGLGVTAFLLKFDRVPEQGLDLTAHAWVPLVLAPLSLAMLRAYPRRGLIHVSLMLLTWGIISVIAPSLLAPGFLALALLAVSAGFQAIEPAIRDTEGPIGRVAVMTSAGLAPIVRAWALGFGVLGGVLTCLILFSEMAGALLGARLEWLAITPLEWWAVLAAILLVGLKILLIPLDPSLFGSAGPEGLIIAGELTGLALLWWLGVADSPLGRWGLDAGDFYPLITAIATLGIVDRNRRPLWTSRGGELAETAGLWSSRLARLTSPLVLLLALVSSAMTLGRENPTTVATLALVAVASMLWAINQGELRTAMLGGLAWLGAGAVAGLVLARRLGLSQVQARSNVAAVGSLVAIYTLWTLAGRLRRRASVTEATKTGSLAGIAQPVSLARVLEGVGFLGALLTVGLVAFSAVQPAMADWITYAGVGSLLAVALFFVLLVPRWQAEWLVYLAQAALLGAYVDLRLAHPLPVASDAAVLTLFAFIDMGIAEVLDRLHLPIYARPTRFTSLVLPVLPLLQLIGTRGVGEVTVFHLVSAATFYAVACGTLRWKTLAYAAGVLYNAALWVLWGQMGWQLADHPQFYLVPVGLSAILFAESNRRELGRETANTIRTAGLIVTYLAMAAPIWQYRSFADWVALLIGSLVGLFVGIGLRVQTFVWLGLVTFLADVLYELGQVSLDHALAKWAIMLSLGILLVFFVALNEKKQIVTTMRGYLAEVRSWE